jgi:TusA-related sulfurtransferase
MAETETIAASAVSATDAPTDAPREVLDVRSLGPPDPLVETMETLPSLAAGTVLVQVNDRAPQHLFPKLEDRGYAHETTTVEGHAVTVIWQP